MCWHAHEYSHMCCLLRGSLWDIRTCVDILKESVVRYSHMCWHAQRRSMWYSHMCWQILKESLRDIRTCVGTLKESIWDIRTCVDILKEHL